jgi:hypothetical protein
MKEILTFGTSNYYDASFIKKIMTRLDAKSKARGVCVAAPSKMEQVLTNPVVGWGGSMSTNPL